jgi:hypothetical protein
MRVLRSPALRDRHRELIALAQGDFFFGRGTPRGLVEDLSGRVRAAYQKAHWEAVNIGQIVGRPAVHVRHVALDWPKKGRSMSNITAAK